MEVNMRHGFGTEHGYFTGWANGGTMIVSLLLVTAVISLIAFTRDQFRKKNHPGHTKLLEILEEKYAINEISADEYHERSMLIEDEYWLDSDNPTMTVSYTHLRAHETRHDLVCRLLLEKKKKK